MRWRKLDFNVIKCYLHIHYASTRKSRMTKTAMNHVQNEQDNGTYMQRIVGSKCTIKTLGGSDSTVNDHKFYDINGLYIGGGESKLLPSIGGYQFVVSYVNGLFVSKNNKTPIEEELCKIINRQSSRRKYADLTPREEKIVKQAVMESYQRKNLLVVLLTFGKLNKRAMVPLKDLFKYVDVVFELPRWKRSGTNDLPVKDRDFVKDELSTLLPSKSFKFYIEGKKSFVRTSSYSEKYVYFTDGFLLSYRETVGKERIYEVKKRALPPKDLTATIQLKARKRIQPTTVAEDTALLLSLVNGITV